VGLGPDTLDRDRFCLSSNWVVSIDRTNRRPVQGPLSLSLRLSLTPRNRLQLAAAGHDMERLPPAKQVVENEYNLWLGRWDL